MSIVISQIEHRATDEGEESRSTAPASAATSEPVRADEVLELLRRERSRRARLWAD